MFGVLDIECRLKYKFKGTIMSLFSHRKCTFYIEFNGHKEIFLQCNVYFDEIPDDIWVNKYLKNTGMIFLCCGKKHIMKKKQNLINS